MNRRPLVILGLALLWSGAAHAVATGAPAGKPWKPPAAPATPVQPSAPTGPPGHDATPTILPVPARPKTPVYIGGVYDTGQFLPDTTVLARVGDRVIRIGRYVDAYFASFAEYRPRPDSLGRVEFLNSMVNKEVLALTALAIDRPLRFEDRTVLRSHTERVLSNVLYRRAVLDSVTVAEGDVQRVYAQYRWQYHLRHIQFSDPNRADAVRRGLLARKLTWSDAVRRYSEAQSPGSPVGDMGWIARASLDMQTALQVCDLEPGGISPVLRDPDGFHIVQLVERRSVEPPNLQAMRRVLQQQIRAEWASVRADRLQAQVAARIGMAYDTTNIEWAASQFRGYQTVQHDDQGPILNLSGSVPELQPADTARVLARHRDVRFSLGDFLHAYNATSPVRRQPVGDFEAFRAQLDAFALEPYMAEEARVRGFERDPLTVAEIANKREEMLVEHLFQDSVQSKVWIEPAERRRYYEDHIAQYATFPSVRFAAIVRDSKEAADSLVARLKGGEKAADILHADSLRGVRSGSIQERRDDERGAHHKILFGELRPGQATVVGPDKEGTWLVLQLLEFDPGRQLAYEEAEQYVVESLQNIRAEELLKTLIARHQRRYRVEAHPEMVMRIRLVDPTLD